MYILYPHVRLYTRVCGGVQGQHQKKKKKEEKKAVSHIIMVELGKQIIKQIIVCCYLLVKF